MEKPSPKPAVDFDNLEGINSLEMARMALRWALERIHSLEQARATEERLYSKQAEDEISSLRKVLAQRVAESEDLAHRYAQMKTFFSMRPEEMRRVGELEITSLIEREGKVARLEKSFNQRQADLELEYQRQLSSAQESARAAAVSAHDVFSRRQSELEVEHEGRRKALDERQIIVQQQERGLADSQKRFEEYCAAQRARLDAEIKERRAEAEQEAKTQLENARRAFERQCLAMERKWADEKTLFQQELFDWQRKAQESLAQLLDARRRMTQAEEAVLRAQEAQRAAEQTTHLTELERQAGLSRLKEWELKAVELEGLRNELKIREERSRLLEESLRKEKDALKEHAFNSEREYRRKRSELDKLKDRMQAEMNELAQQYKSGDSPKKTKEK